MTTTPTASAVSSHLADGDLELTKHTWEIALKISSKGGYQ